MLSYEREAFYAKDDHEFRITFDQNILWRNYDLSLCKGIYGEAILDKNKVLMEVKTGGRNTALDGSFSDRKSDLQNVIFQICDRLPHDLCERAEKKLSTGKFLCVYRR